ncbi:MAG: ATP-dependent helicase, partial [Selenomonadales bacterium]|nr:ATP-dependent helicase [Selenomonadales bacterium]
EAVLLARPTQSLTLYIQQAMRAMRPDKNNPAKRAVIIDHVGNVFRHGLPDEDRMWSLETKRRKAAPRAVGVKVCERCFKAYWSASVCPYCGYAPPKAEREEMPKEADGQLLKVEDVERKARRQEVGKARSIEELEQIAIRRGYSMRWVTHIAKAKGIKRYGRC